MWCSFRGALCIPAFEIVLPEVEEVEEEGEGQEGKDADDTVFAPAYNYEDLDYTVKPDFVDTVRHRTVNAEIVRNSCVHSSLSIGYCDDTI